MELLYNIAKSFYEETWDNEKIKIHSACVIDACLSMVGGTTLDARVFMIAGWLHDLGQKDDKDRHHEVGLLYSKLFFQQHSEYANLQENVDDCILHHRTGGSPTTLYGRIMQVADKVALKNNKWLEYKARNS